MGINCEININKPANGTFIPGSTVAGIIKYAFDEVTTVKKIIISLKGFGYLQMRNKRRTDDRRRHLYINDESYVDLDNVILEDEKKFPIGSHETSFSFRLPVNIPPTFMYCKLLPIYNVRCVIGYYIRIKFERPGFFTSDKHFRKEITVVSGITPRYPTIPTTYGEEKNPSEQNNGLDVKANIKNSVVTPGGKLELDYEVVNNSNVVVEGVELKLIETYIFKPKGYITLRVLDDVIGSEMKTAPIGVGETQKMQIVMNAPTENTSIENAGMVSKDCSVRLTALLPAPYSSTILEIPVQIGYHCKSDDSLDNKCDPNTSACKPYAPADNQYAPSAPPYTPDQPADKNDSSAPSSGNSRDDPPPSYWEVMSEHKEDGKNRNFLNLF